MRESAASMELSRDIAAAPERLWDLLGNSAAWSLRPGRFAFDVPGSPPGAGRLACVLGAIGEVKGGAVIEVRDEEPGRMISYCPHSALSSERQVVTLSARSARRGATACLAVRQVVPRRGTGLLAGSLANRAPHLA